MLVCSLLLGSASVVADSHPTITPSETPVVLGEDSSLREPYIKYFENNDGTITATVYDSPIHYEKDGLLKEIDNTFQLEEKANNESVWRNTANDFIVRLPITIDETSQVSIEYENYFLKFGLVETDIKTVTGIVSNPPSDKEVAVQLNAALDRAADEFERTRLLNESKTAVRNQRAEIQYKDILSNTDLQYQLNGKTLKENIIFRTAPSEIAYTFDLEYTDLVGVLQENNSILFFDKDDTAQENVIFILAAPYMFDNKDIFNSDIQVVLEETENGARYTLIPDKEWLNDPEREYPVTLDPTVYTKQDAVNDQDNHVCESTSNANTNWMTLDRMYAGTWKSGSSVWENRIYVRLPLPSEIKSANWITKATFTMWLYPTSSFQSASDLTLDLHKVNYNWNSSTITWNTQKNYTIGTKISSVTSNNTDSSNTWTITSLAKSWYSGTNNGLMIKASKKDSAKTNRTCYTSSDSGDASKRPKATFTYSAGVKGIRTAPATSYASYNCQSYAFWLTPVDGTDVFSKQFTYADYVYCCNASVSSALDITKDRMEVWLDKNFSGKWREVTSYNSALQSNEWLVCMRVGVGDYDGDGVRDYDYHYWYRANTGDWYNKHGYRQASEKVSGNVVNPSTANTSDGWKLNGEYFYTSSTVYYAIQT